MTQRCPTLLCHVTFKGVRQLNCVKLHCQDLLGDNPERLFLVHKGTGTLCTLKKNLGSHHCGPKSCSHY